MLETYLKLQLWRRGINVKNVYFQQDGATAHTAAASMRVVKKMFPGKLISRFGDVMWPPSAILIAMDSAVPSTSCLSTFVSRNVEEVHDSESSVDEVQRLVDDSSTDSSSHDSDDDDQHEIVCPTWEYFHRRYAPD
ncbi:hypothetical protein J6590_041291 [Homalodisca vitripennis]|nr:hypothetical protein J6590_041291 [Homalodisca vitripennis]